LKSTDPILLPIPESFESNRLIIRAPLWEDGKMVNEAIKESINELQPWMPWAQQIPTLEELRLSHDKVEFIFWNVQT
jgi:hypothetical protein